MRSACIADTRLTVNNMNMPSVTQKCFSRRQQQNILLFSRKVADIFAPISPEIWCFSVHFREVPPPISNFTYVAFSGNRVDNLRTDGHDETNKRLFCDYAKMRLKTMPGHINPSAWGHLNPSS